MTVSTATSRVDYTGNGVTVAFPVPFPFITDAYLVVVRTIIATGVSTTLTLDSIGADGYSVTGAGDATGTVTVITAPTALQRLSIIRAVAGTQEADFVANDPFPAETFEDSLDKLQMQINDIATTQSRSPVLFDGDVDGAGRYNANGNRMADLADGVEAQDAVTVTQLGEAASANVPFVQAGTGAVARTVQNKLRDLVSVKDFGATGDGVTDDTAAIQLAVDYAQSLVADRLLSGCTVFFPAGMYLISSTLSVTTSAVCLAGESPSSAVLYAPNGGFDMVHFEGTALFLYHVGMRDIRFYTPGNATSGCQLRVTKCINAIFDSIIFSAWFDGLVIDSCGKVYFDNCIWAQEGRTNGTTPRYAIDFASTSNNNSDIHVSNYQIMFDTVTQNTNYSVSIRGSDGIYFNNGHQHGGVLFQPTGGVCASVFWSQVYFDTAAVENVIFNGTSSAYRNFAWSNCYFRDSGAQAISFDSASTITDVLIHGCLFGSHDIMAIECVTTVNDLVISGCVFKDNNTANSASGGDIFITGRATILGCRFIGGGAAGTAINLSASSNSTTLSNCNIAQTTAGTRVTNSGAATNRIRSNTGFATKAAGAVTITNPATTATVNHTLAVTPSIAQISLTLNSASAGVTRFWLSAVTATQFQINLDATPTTTATIGWFIDAEL